MPDEVTAAPWTKDLETAFADPAIREQVDAFLRGNVQPHVTRLEQTSRDALALYNDLTNEETAAQAYYTITEQLFGEDLAESVLNALGGAEEDPPAEPAAAAAEPDVDAEMRAEWLAQKQAREYREALDAFKKTNEVPETFNEKIFAPFVVGAGGDLDAAYEGYKEFIAETATAFGVVPEQIEVPQPPPTLGNAPASAPVAKKYGSIADAVDDFMAEQQAGPPPTVGSV